jgi:2-dehydro-3-deoxy-D-pentonate aldolase
MPALPRHHGVIVPLVTPVTADGRLDTPAAARLVDHVASNGCGMMVLGTTGEIASLAPPLRRRYVEIAVRVAARRTPVFACIAHNCFSESVASAQDYLRTGVDAVVSMLPNYYKLEPDDMETYFTQLAARVPGPLLLYNIPQTVGMSLPIDVIERLAHHPNIAGLKDSENTPGRRELIATRLGGRSEFALFMGVSAHSVAALRLGFVGLVPSPANLFPARWRELFDAAMAGDWARAEQLQQQLDKLSAIFQRDRALGRSLAALKVCLATRNLCGPHMLPPLRALSAAEQETIGQELAAAG